MALLTLEVLREFLDERLGSDRRSRDSSYADAATMLAALGLFTVEQLQDTLAGVEDLEVSRVATGGRVGQLHRLELMLLASLGVQYIDKHPWGHLPFWRRRQRRLLQAFQNAGLTI